MNNTSVAVWKSNMLPYSETFIRTQGESLVRYRTHYLGLQDTDELELPPDRTFTLDRSTGGRVAVPLFKATGLSPTLVRQLRQRDVALVHAHFGTEAWRALQLSSQVDRPVVVTFHGADATMSDTVLRKTSSSGRQYVRHRNEIFRRTDLVLAVSQFIADRLVAAGCPPGRVRVHEIGVDTSIFRPTTLNVVPEEILFVGRLVVKKGVAYLVEAMARLRASGTFSGRLVIIGDGPERSGLEAMADRLRLPVCFLGRQDHEAVRTRMHRALALVVPSHDAPTGETEGLPTVIREAQASGVPVVVTSTAGAREAVNDEIDGLVVEPRDSIQLAAALARIIRDDGIRPQLVSGGIRSAKAKDVKTQARILEDMYDEVLEVSAG